MLRREDMYLYRHVFLLSIVSAYSVIIVFIFFATIYNLPQLFDVFVLLLLFTI